VKLDEMAIVLMNKSVEMNALSPLLVSPRINCAINCANIWTQLFASCIQEFFTKKELPLSRGHYKLGIS
jgi:hypothetical protein